MKDPRRKVSQSRVIQILNRKMPRAPSLGEGLVPFVRSGASKRVIMCHGIAPSEASHGCRNATPDLARPVALAGSVLWCSAECRSLACGLTPSDAILRASALDAAPWPCPLLSPTLFYFGLIERFLRARPTQSRAKSCDSSAVSAGLGALKSCKGWK